MSTRIYLVTINNEEKHLVDASSQSQAIRHVARNMFSAKPATTHEVAALIGDGAKVEKATP